MAWEPDYVELADFKDYLGMDADDTSDDTILGLDISAASRAIDRCCSNRFNGMGARRQFGKLAAPAAFYLVLGFGHS